ncbi:MAG TPA: hypothetical protein VFQ39_20625 [Longimicrobium sp.]|nr:hypothetical protein [Longimicrobium sp.]
MKGYDPTNGDSDDIALKIADDPAMVAVLTKNQRKLLVLGLFNGNTPASEEKAAMTILKAANKSDLNWIENQIGWEDLYSELDTDDVALLRGRTGNLDNFDPTDDDADNIAVAIANHPSWLANFNPSAKLVLVRALLDGKTYASEENAALKILRSLYGSPTVLLQVVRDLTWPRLESELGTAALAELRIQTLDFKDFDPTDDNADEIAEKFAARPDVLKKLTRNQRRMLVEALFGDYTPESQEDAARDILLSEPTGNGLAQLCCDVGGWERLLYELDGDALDAISASISKKLDADGRIFLAAAPWLYQQLPINGTLPGKSVEAIVNALPKAKQVALLDTFLENWAALVSQLRSRFRRGQDVEEEFELTLTFAIARLAANTGHRVGEATQLRFEVRYTFLAARNLYEGDYGALAEVLPDMADPEFPLERRVAVFQVFLRLSPDFTAMRELMKKYGNADQRVRLQRFDNVKDAFIHAFDATLPPQSLLDQIREQLNAVGEAVTGTLVDLRAMIGILAQELLFIPTWDSFTGNMVDDNARMFISLLDSMPSSGNINILSRLPTYAKQKLCGFCFDGFTVDEDEEAILNVLTTTKASNRAEFFQLLAALTFTTLDAKIHGEEWESFLALLRCG